MVGVDRPVYGQNIISINLYMYIKSHLELQREITLIELAPSPYYFVKSIFPVFINMFAKFDEILAMTSRHYGNKTLQRTDAPTNKVKTVYEGRFLCSKKGRFNENGESRCIHHAYVWKD